MSNFAPHPGCDREIPRYRATRDIRPAEKPRFRLEPPFETIFDNDVWQYGEKNIARNEIIETTSWPHPSFQALNYSAQATLAFFTSAMKSRLTRSPWRDGAMWLDNGLSNAPAIFDVKPPQIKPMNMRPVA